MRTLVFMLASMLIVACGDAGNSQTTASAEVDFCTCVNEPMTSNARVKVCNDLMNNKKFRLPRVASRSRGRARSVLLPANDNKGS